MIILHRIRGEVVHSLLGLKTSVRLGKQAGHEIRSHFVESLRPKTGMEPEVSEFVLQSAETQGLLDRLRPLLDYTLPRYAREGKAYLTIAFGCTGGRHRSVAVAEELGRQLGETHEVVVSHRDAERTTA